MLQYRLSTLFLIFFFVAATLALFGTWGIWISGILFVAVICLNRAKDLTNGVMLFVSIVFIGIVCPGSFQAAIEGHNPSARINACTNNMKQIGIGLHKYHDSQRHFPSVYACDKAGKPLYSWIVSILPDMEYDMILNGLNREEPWDSPRNTEVLSRVHIEQLFCPSVKRKEQDCFSNYIAILGPGTIWRKEGAVKLSDLPDGGSHTIAVVEMANADVPWAKPFALTVEEVLENMKNGKGIRISSCDYHGVNVLFANGTVRRLPLQMPLSLWRKILNGELKEQYFDNIDSLIDPNAPDMVDVFYTDSPGRQPWTIKLGVIVWLISVVLLCHRAVKSRKKPEITAAIQSSSAQEK
jgi:hypothetical protein